MNRLQEIKARLETLDVEIKATSEQKERARQGYDDAAIAGDQERMKRHGTRFETCEQDLALMRQEVLDLLNEKIVEIGKPISTEALIAELKRRGLM